MTMPALNPSEIGVVLTPLDPSIQNPFVQIRMPDPLPEVPPVRSLYIAVPAYTGQITTQTAHSLIGAVSALQAAGVDVTTDFLSGNCYLDHSRNLLVDRFLASKAQDLLFIDADVGFPPEAALRIATATRPFIAGIYPKKSDKPEWPVEFPGASLTGDGGLIEAAKVATGFLRIHRGVFDRMIVDTYDHEDRQIRRFFRCDVRDGLYWGEDFNFAQAWRMAGGRCWVIPDLDFEHVGVKSWRGNWGNWVRSPEVQTAAREAAE